MQSAQQLLNDVDLHSDPSAPRVLELIERLVNHELYQSVTDLPQARTFMQYQVWCVWDFMCLAKSVQIGVGCYAVPWIPPPNTALVQAVNGILQGEEADVGPDGRPGSHLEIFIAAMDEAEADSEPIRTFIDRLRAGLTFEEAVGEPRIPKAAARFMRTTMNLATRPLHCRVASFCLTREELVPRMFYNFIPRLAQAREQMAKFLWYLKRHVELDTGIHGPFSRTLLRETIGKDPVKRREAMLTVIHALEARRAYLDATLAAIRGTVE